ncbi:MAG: hypothetical protein HY694_02380 [Deltaproteobacteria bacterium]|nr:hypothetical protein [Deltaproteobacteria bacterium]
MNQPYTSERQFSASVTIGSRYYLDPARSSPSLRLRDPDPNDTFVVNFVSPQVFKNTLSWEDLSVADAPGEESQPTDYVKFQDAKRYFQEHKAQILEKYKGNFVAILDNTVVDHDSKFSELARRVYEKFGYQTIYMPFVESKPSVLRIPSPRMGKHRVDALRKEV